MDTGCELVFEPGFSPGGDSLAHTCVRGDGDYALNLLELRGGKNRRLFGGPRDIQGAAWTRDGARIIFSSVSLPRGVESGDLWQITLGQSESPEKVPAGHDAASPVISSSGKRLAYVPSRINGNIGPTLGSRATFPQRDFWTAVRGCALSG